MNSRISETLYSIEQQNGCTVLYACESGSRAWGFASPDSDYDVRFIYTHPIEWYLQLEKAKDTIDEMLPGDLDMGGWELQKTLRLFHGCNLALNEWIGSPVVYSDDHGLKDTLAELMPEYFNRKKALFHYLNMASGAWESRNSDGSIRIKKLFYVLRPLLACCWIHQHASMPPTAFSDLLDARLVDDALLDIIRDLLVIKSESVEGFNIEIPESLLNWSIQTQTGVERIAKETAPAGSGEWAPLNRLLLEYVARW